MRQTKKKRTPSLSYEIVISHLWTWNPIFIFLLFFSNIRPWGLQTGGSSNRERESCLWATPISNKISPEDGSFTMISFTRSHRKSSSWLRPSNPLSPPKLRLALITLSKCTLVSNLAKHGWSKWTSRRPFWSRLYDFTLSGKSPAGRPWLSRRLWMEEVAVRGRWVCSKCKEETHFNNPVQVFVPKQVH